MPTIFHEGPLLIFREAPALLVRLLRDRIGVTLPASDEIRVDESDFTQVTPSPFRADLVLTIGGEKPKAGIILEVQRRVDRRKRYTWPLYAAALHARLRCDVHLVIFSMDPSVARWAKQLIGSIGALAFTPLIIGPEDIPSMPAPAEARQAPELAVLSALADASTGHQIEVAIAALDAIDTSDLASDQKMAYHDVVLAAYHEMAPKILELMMQTKSYQFQSEFAKTHFSLGKLEGKLEGRGESILAVLIARKLLVSDEVRARVLHCTDLGVLQRWLTRAVTCSTAAELFSDS